MENFVDTLRDYYEKHRTEILNDYYDLLRFKSISTDPAFKKETRTCAEWLCKYFENIGMEVSLWESSGHPVVFATHMKAGPGRPTVLLYNHYDVQPVDPLELWKSDPFEPAIRDGVVYARGAVDNKGQCAYTMAALKAFLRLAEKVNINIKVFIEGEEETGSKGTFEVLEKKKEELRADYLLIVDFGIPAPNTPGIHLGTRGLTAMDVECKNSSIDLHSGIHGGIALNPNRALACALATLWDEKGAIAVPGFYENVKPFEKLEESFDEKEYVKKFGVKAFAREEGYSLIETNWVRPTLEINGMSGGYTGEGFKTVIPAMAKAKISCRLVPEQDPHDIVVKIRDFLEKQVPKGIELIVTEHHGAPAYRCPSDTPLILIVAKAFEEVFNKKCRYLLCGASVPIVPSLAAASQAQTALVGVGLDDDDIHAPNEHFGLDRFEQGFLTIGRILDLL